MSFELIVGILVGLIIIIVVGLLTHKKRPRRVKTNQYVAQWKEIQKLCPDKASWAQAITEADDMLDDVLKKKRLKGGSMGERLVEAQKLLTDNDSVWYAHKLRKKIDENPDLKLKKNDVKDALVGIRLALKDLGAL